MSCSAPIRIAIPIRRLPESRRRTRERLLDTLAARIANELGDQPEVQAEMLTVIGRTYDRLGLVDTSLPLLERALEIGRRSFRLPDARVAQTLNDLGVAQRRVGNLTAALPLLEEGLSMRRTLLGDNHKDVAVSVSEYGRTLRDVGRYHDAEGPTREALAIRTRIFGDEHRETATSKTDLGLLLLDRGEIAEAERLFRESLATTERLLGAEHPNAAASKNFVGMVLAVKGDYAARGTAATRSPRHSPPCVRSEESGVRLRRAVAGEHSGDAGAHRRGRSRCCARPSHWWQARSATTTRASRRWRLTWPASGLPLAMPPAWRK